MTARTPAGTPPPAARITILDILRALALLGIVIVHTHDHFNLYLPMPPAEGWQAAANSAADWAYEHLFVSKSFLLFSFLFGLSFFIQLDRREQQGIDFRKRFMWRLTLLFLLGLAHTLFYDGDILTLFGTLGFALVMLYKCGTPLLITLCALCLIQPVMLMDLLNHAGLADWWPHSSGWFHTGSPAAGPTREFLYAHGSWGQAALWNLTQGQAGKWQFFLLSGRLWQTLGLFILGMLAGRWRAFEDASNKRSLFLRTLGVAGLLFLALLAMRLYLIPQLGAPLEADAARLLHRINIVRLSLIITVDFPAKLRIFFKGKPVGMQEFLRRFQALTFQKLLIIQTMLKRDLSRCISRGSAANTPLFHKHAIHTALFQKVCRQNSDNAAADNQHISFRIPLQLRKAWRLCTVLPD